MSKNYKELIVDRINTFEDGYVFTQHEFLELAERETIRKTLNRLVDAKYLIRVLKGYYYKPSFNEKTKTYNTVKVDDVAIAIARRNNWTIAPHGQAALYNLGLVSEFPDSKEYLYITNGRYIQYSYDDITIRFIHRKTGDIKRKSRLTGMIIDAIRTIGRENIDQAFIDHFKQRLTAEEKEMVFYETISSSHWILEVVRKIARPRK